MIARPEPNWLRMLFVWKGSVTPSIIPQLLLMLLVALLVMRTGGRIFGDKIPLTPAPFTLLGVALAIFLAFRNNASYERYGDARRLWGRLLIAARTLTTQLRCYVPSGAPDEVRQAFANRLIGLAYMLKHQLRKTDPAHDLARFIPGAELGPLSRSKYKSVRILRDLRAELSAMHRSGLASDTQLWMFDAQLNELGAVVGGCERIAATPIPFAYGVLLHRTVYAYCLMLPFGLVDSIGMATPVISVFVSYTLLGLEAIAREVADPFGLAPNSLALDAMTLTIERSVLELCDLPLPAEPGVGKGYLVT